MLSLLNRLDSGIARGEQWLLAVFCGILTLIMVIQVVLRYFFNAPLFWAEEISTQLLAFITALGLAYLTHTKQHICIDFVIGKLNGKARTAVALVSNTLLLALMTVLCFYAWEWVLRPEVQAEISGTTGLPRWYTFAALPVALTLLCLHQTVVTVNHCTGSQTEVVCPKPTGE
ncbi:TRAP transporter small permease [Neisseria animalis]|uniref:TRAP transporter small permease protein n=1 Tax=Neisseria animalis TaxID=492 RepID=A0A5P3MQJ9_NEIAN|nr:TRAP transporter small permease [Neisseria animalis]QEY23863.1 TRAP transporter small permease [Neisseria animalis]ROW32071.1 TRAP transporter small permease [Neisseria animalis]VEE05736.1 Neu5Ac permease [Neisseria animalis]